MFGDRRTQVGCTKRVRGSDRARGARKPEGIVIIADVWSHQAGGPDDLEFPVPSPGDPVSVRLVSWVPDPR